MYLGIDIGSLAAKGVLLDAAGRVAAWTVIPSGHDHPHAAEEVTRLVLDAAGAEPGALLGTVGTGYGRASIARAGRKVTEITCHAHGAHALDPACRTVIDIGGQDSKVIRLDARGRVVDFAMNDRCAAGTGRFLEVMAQTLAVPLAGMGAAALAATRTARISNVCTVFAESEVVGLIAGGEARPNIVRGICRAIAERVGAMAGRVGGDQPDHLGLGED
ncbi:MAG TPA: acyl-CoA dehydratase activase, partial [Candidatus Methanoperedens sp.]|nr:acyl-CoA dehydratase activase [Candidatus Methanoperedens sp.]